MVCTGLQLRDSLKKVVDFLKKADKVLLTMKIKNYSIIDADGDCDGQVGCKIKVTLEDGSEINGYVYVNQFTCEPDWTTFEKSN